MIMQYCYGNFVAKQISSSEEPEPPEPYHCTMIVKVRVQAIKDINSYRYVVFIYFYIVF